MPSVVVLNEQGRQVEFNFKQILTIDGMPYASSNQELRDAVISLESRLSLIERMLVIAEPEMSQGVEEI